MKIYLFGYGKMGKEVERIACARGHEIVDLSDANVCIDFSHPDAVFGNAQKAVKADADLVIGTTSWEKNHEAVKNLVSTNNLGCVYAPNFSLGIYLYKQVLSQAAALINRYDDYDVAGTEIHHNQKVDRPSGTALSLTELLAQMMPKRKLVEFSSVRCGHVAGTHTVMFDSSADTITLTHEAKNRSGFALGAVIAAELIQGTKGWLSFEELLTQKEYSFV